MPREAFGAAVPCGQMVAGHSDTELRCAMSSEHETGTRIADLTSRLAALDRARAAIIVDLAELRRQQDTRQVCQERSCQEPAQAAVTMKSSAAEKIAVFRSVFRGREDVSPRRWDNAKTGKSGYSPACDNEWISGIRGKPKIKCGECPQPGFSSNLGCSGQQSLAEQGHRLNAAQQ